MGFELGEELDEEVVEVEEGEFGEFGFGWHDLAGGAYYRGVFEGFK